MSSYQPKPEHKFTFGMWTVGNVGRDPFGEPVRQALKPLEIVRLLADVGAYGVNLHDNDLLPIDATPAERSRIIAEFRNALKECGLVAPMATTNLFSDPAFKDGAFTANDPKVRALALQKTMHSIDLGVELGAQNKSAASGSARAPANAKRSSLYATKSAHIPGAIAPMSLRPSTAAPPSVANSSASRAVICTAPANSAPLACACRSSSASFKRASSIAWRASSSM